MRRVARVVRSVWPLALLMLCGCLPHHHGRFDASGASDERAAQVEPAQCGGASGPAADGSWFLASVGSDSVRVRLTSRDPVSRAVVAVWPEGEPEAVRRSEGVLAVHGLQPEARYCYAVQLNGVRYAPHGFVTPPRVGEGSVELLVIGDSGGHHPDQRVVAAALAQARAHALVHTGDIAYPAGTHATYREQLFHPFAEVLARLPLHAVPGNHDDKAERGRAFIETFGATPRSVDIGPVHLALLDTDWPLPEQIPWLDEDLASTSQPWKIVVGHHPPYASGPHGSDRRARELLSPLLARHGVQLVLNGHDHHYERTRTIDGTVFIVSGGGGHSTRPVRRQSFTARVEEVLHFVQIRATRYRLDLTAVDAGGHVFDRASLSP